MKYVLTLVCICMCGRAIAQPATPSEVITQADQFATTAGTVLDNDLADYPSARFRNVRATFSPRIEGKESKLTFCGELNAKNHMGGYTGWTSFALFPDDGSIIVGDDTPISKYTPDVLGASIVERICKNGVQVWLPADYTSAFAPKH